MQHPPLPSPAHQRTRGIFKSVDLGARPPKFESWLCYLVAVQPERVDFCSMPQFPNLQITMILIIISSHKSSNDNSVFGLPIADTPDRCPAHSCPSPGSRTRAPSRLPPQKENWFGSGFHSLHGTTQAWRPQARNTGSLGVHGLS